MPMPGCQCASCRNADVQKLQRVHNMTAKVEISTSQYDDWRMTAALKTLYWLPIRIRVEFKALTLEFGCMHGQALMYLSVLVNPNVTSRRQGLRFGKRKLHDATSESAYNNCKTYMLTDPSICVLAAPVLEDCFKIERSLSSLLIVRFKIKSYSYWPIPEFTRVTCLRHFETFLRGVYKFDRRRFISYSSPRQQIK